MPVRTRRKGRKARKRKAAARLKRLLRWFVSGLVIVSATPVIALRWLPPPTSAVMLQRTLTEGRIQDYQWVPLSQISPQAALAVIAAEDQKFPDHWGFDFKEIRSAAKDHAQGGRLRGASTLTQQVARNLFLWQGRSYLRKGLEAWITILLETIWPKQRILEVYLNIAEMGDHTFGVEAASRRFFGRHAGSITAGQAAVLAAVLPNPHRFHAEHPSAYTLDRSQQIMQQMHQLGGISYIQELLPTPVN